MSLPAAEALVAEGEALLRTQNYQQAIPLFSRASEIMPSFAPAWKGLGQALLLEGRPREAATAFDRSIGLVGTSVTALWGGALAHAESGNRIIAQTYLKRALALQPTWVQMAHQTPSLAPLLALSATTREQLVRHIGALPTKTFRDSQAKDRAVEIAKLADLPQAGVSTYLTVGLSDTPWDNPQLPRMEIVLGLQLDDEGVSELVARAAFHCMTHRYYPGPGALIPGIGERLPRLGGFRFPHVYFTVPKQWPIKLPLLSGVPTVTLVQMVPLLDVEFQFGRQAGRAAFEARLAQSGLNFFDPQRPAFA